MTNRSVVHDTFVVERTYPSSTARVFSAWADPAFKSQWFGEPGVDDPNYELDFRVGGHERTSGNPGGGTMHFTYDAIYQDIVDGERIVYTYEMQLNGNRVSVSVASVEFRSDGDGTRLVLTEHGAYLDGYDTSAAREHGTGELLNALGRALEAQ
jgi:uncharacterized protein YndB with AHSA1/START domain